MSEKQKITDQQALQGSYNYLMVCQRLRGASLLGSLIGLTEDEFVSICLSIYKTTWQSLEATKQDLLLKYNQEDLGDAKV
jgi:hypothetical protein